MGWFLYDRELRHERFEHNKIYKASEKLKSLLYLTLPFREDPSYVKIYLAKDEFTTLQNLHNNKKFIIQKSCIENSGVSHDGIHWAKKTDNISFLSWQRSLSYRNQSTDLLS